MYAFPQDAIHQVFPQIYHAITASFSGHLDRGWANVGNWNGEELTEVDSFEDEFRGFAWVSHEKRDGFLSELTAVGPIFHKQQGRLGDETLESAKGQVGGLGGHKDAAHRSAKLLEGSNRRLPIGLPGSQKMKGLSSWSSRVLFASGFGSTRRGSVSPGALGRLLEAGSIAGTGVVGARAGGGSR
jgi:hypothetical protein